MAVTKNSKTWVGLKVFSSVNSVNQFKSGYKLSAKIESEKKIRVDPLLPHCPSTTLNGINVLNQQLKTNNCNNLRLIRQVVVWKDTEHVIKKKQRVKC